MVILLFVYAVNFNIFNERVESTLASIFNLIIFSDFL